MDADAVKTALLEAGIFAFIKQRPYDIIADPTVTPEKDQGEPRFTMEDMVDFGLVGQADSALRRQSVGKALGIGYGNGKSFLQKLNKFGITAEELYKAIGDHR